MNYLKIKNEFEKKYNLLKKDTGIIYSAKGNEEYIINDEIFKQIYIPLTNNDAKYTKFRSVFYKNYFIGNKGTLLKLEKNNEIKFIQNVDKNSQRRSYTLPLKKRKKTQKFRDYQLMAIVFESNSIEQADLLLKKYGIRAFKKGVEVHHIRGLKENNPKNLQILTKECHKLLEKKIPDSFEETKKYLQTVSKIFENTNNPNLIITNKVFDKNGIKITDKQNKFSQITDITSSLKNHYFKNKMVEYEGVICTLYINPFEKKGILIDENNQNIRECTYEELIFYNFIQND